MSEIKLNTSGEKVTLSEISEVIRLNLFWEKKDILSLSIIYEDLEGTPGILNFCNPLIIKENKYSLKYEGRIWDSNLNLFKDTAEINGSKFINKITFFAANYTELVLKNPINYSNYFANLKVFMNSSESSYNLSITDELPGNIILLGKLDFKNRELEQINKTISISEFKELYPWASKKERCFK